MVNEGEGRGKMEEKEEREGKDRGEGDGGDVFQTTTPPFYTVKWKQTSVDTRVHSRSLRLAPTMYFPPYW